MKEGKPTFGLFIDSASPLVAELVATLGFDYVLVSAPAGGWHDASFTCCPAREHHTPPARRLAPGLQVDAQHSPVNDMAAMLTAASAGGSPVLVRVGGPHDMPGIQQALDLGAWGIMVPTVKTEADVRRVVDATFFPPLGSRRCGAAQREGRAWGCCHCRAASMQGAAVRAGAAPCSCWRCSGELLNPACHMHGQPQKERQGLEGSPPHARRHRSIAWPIRPQLGRGVEEFLNAANDEVLLMVQIETRESLEDIDQARGGEAVGGGVGGCCRMGCGGSEGWG